MKVERWNPPKHLPRLDAWLRAHGSAPHAGNAFIYPPTGFVVDDCVVGFIFTTNAPLIGYIDNVSTDPGASTKRLHAALSRLCVELVDEARRLGIAWLRGHTAQPGMVRIACRHGFKSGGSMTEIMSVLE